MVYKITVLKLILDDSYILNLSRFVYTKFGNDKVIGDKVAREKI